MIRWPDISRRRALLIVAGVVGCAGVLMLGLSTLVITDECVDLKPSDLELVEIGNLQKRVRAHATDPTQALVLSGDELSFLVGDYLEYPVRLSVQDSRLFALVTLVQSPGCINVAFEGGVEIQGGLADVTVNKLAVGHLGLTNLLQGETYRFTPEDVPGGRASDLLAHVASLVVEGDEVRVTVHDVGTFF